jgi:heme/copper-type cytochrome/quinol oxidase subunit 2
VNGSFLRKRLPIAAAACAASLVAIPHALAAASPNEPFKWSHWWMPVNHAEHGHQVDLLFVWIFVITMLALVGVQAAFVGFLIKYRHNPNRKKAHFIHGNTRLEMLWTLIPAVILAVLALASKQVWSHYRNPQVPDSEKAQMMIIAEQFAWNVIYPGPDGKVGKYLSFPRISDGKWPDGKRYGGTSGPRDIPKDQVRGRINTWISDSEKDPLGKVYDPAQDIANSDGKAAGLDDDWVRNPGRPMIVPVEKTIEIILGSKDVLHSFSLPNFRVKLDAVPGMMGHIYFKPERSSISVETKAVESLTLGDKFFVEPDIKGSTFTDNFLTFPDPKNPGIVIGTLSEVRNVIDQRLALQNITAPTDEQRTKELATFAADLRAAGIERLPVITQIHEIACQELCGIGHTTMRGLMLVVEQAQYDRLMKAPRDGTPMASAN